MLNTANKLNTLDTQSTPDTAAAQSTLGNFRFPRLLKSGRCSFCPSAPIWWVYTDPKTRAVYCMNCLVALAADPSADPSLAAIGCEILHARSLDTSRPAAPVLPAVKLLDVAGGRFCTDCGKFGLTWQNPDTCDMFCLACTQHFIEWQEGELSQGYAALARLSEMPASEARTYRRLVRCQSHYQAAA